MFSAQTPLDHAPPYTAGLDPCDLLRCHFTDRGAKGTAELEMVVAQCGIGPTFIAEPAKSLSWPGSPTLFLKLARSTWRTDRMRFTKDQRLEMPVPHFSIHLEARVLLWKPALAILLFYESHPCFSQQELIARLDAESLKLYVSWRNGFLHELARHCHVTGFKLHRFPQQIGRAEFRFHDATVADGSAWLRPIIHEVSTAIDQTLSCFGGRRAIVPIDVRPSAA